MRYKYLLLLLFIIYGCAPLKKTIIENTERLYFQPLVLIPDYDIYDIRIDIIRQTDEKEVDESTTKTEEVPYHPVGFYLGNGLFVDLNDNISLLVPKLLNVDSNEDFVIKQKQPGIFFKSTTIYAKTDSLFIAKNGGLIKLKTKKIIDKNDSTAIIKGGLFSKYKIIESDSSITYRSGLAKTVIHKNKEGYFYKTWLWKKEYKQIESDIHIGKKYIIRNLGDRIEILTKGMLNKERLAYRIIKSDDRIYIFDSFYRGLEIVQTKNEIKVKENTRNLGSYSIEL